MAAVGSVSSLVSSSKPQQMSSCSWRTDAYQSSMAACSPVTGDSTRVPDVMSFRSTVTSRNGLPASGCSK